MVQDEIDVGPRSDRDQALQEFVGGKDQVARAVMPRAPERALHAAIGEAREPFLSERWAQKVAAETFERGAIVGADGAIGVEIEALEVRVARADGPHPRRVGGATDAQDRRAGTLPEGRSTADGGGGELRQHGRVVGEGIGREIRRVVIGEHASAPQQAQDAGTDGGEYVDHLAIGRRGRGIEARGAVWRGGKDSFLC